MEHTPLQGFRLSIPAVAIDGGNSTESLQCCHASAAYLVPGQLRLILPYLEVFILTSNGVQVELRRSLTFAYPSMSGQVRHVVLSRAMA